MHIAHVNAVGKEEVPTLPLFVVASFQQCAVKEFFIEYVGNVLRINLKHNFSANQDKNNVLNFVENSIQREFIQ